MMHDSEGIGELWALLKRVQLELDAEEIADLLWLAVQMGEIEKTSATKKTAEETQTNIIKTEIEDSTESPAIPPLANPKPAQPAASVNLPSPSDDQSESQTASKSIPFKAPAAPGLRNQLALARALRPLMRKVSSRTQKILDTEETVTQFAENRILIPKFQPAPERWLDLALVVEKSSSIVIWQEIIAEFQKLIELSGAFRSVSTWSLQTDEKGEIKLFAQQNKSINKQRSRSPKELLDSAGRRLILLVSDCTSQIWYQEKIYDILKLWSNSGPSAIVQPFPEQLWTRTAMGFGYQVLLNALVPGVPNKKLTLEGLPIWEDVDVNKGITLPVITLEPNSLKQWSRVVAGFGSTQTAGILFEPTLILEQSKNISQKDAKTLSAKDLVNRFRATASLTARRLAGLMATVPVSLPVVHLIQQTLLKESMQVHVAEVFMSGLLKPVSTATKGEMTNYDFVEIEGVRVRDLLIDSVPTPDVDKVLHEVSQYIAKKAGISIENFAALLSPDTEWDDTTKQDINIQSFAKVTTDVLHRLGGEYKAFAEYLEQKSSPSSDKTQSSDKEFKGFPPLQTCNFEIATISVEDGEIEDEPDVNQVFEFEVATIELEKSALFQRNRKLIINRRRQQAYGFIEYVENEGNEIALEMLQIPGGSFLMGSPEDEPERSSHESPQHTVTISPFYMGKYPVTQAQWQAVAALPQVNRELDPNPSRFKGANRPVESVSWYDAVEFCLRLSQHTGKSYRLPSEAEWEYACRARTTTPFHFGETITSQLANYDGRSRFDDIQGLVDDAKGNFDDMSQGQYREQTTEVGSFGVANAFGLYNMHGNVWEWCLDDWHDNYEGAPTDGSAWFDNNDNTFQKQGRAVLRGGSWYNDPENCRCAYRNLHYRAERSYINDVFGFRVVCAFGRTL
jgi:formylglycine-generating enzyme required for sulfatase activity